MRRLFYILFLCFILAPMAYSLAISPAFLEYDFQPGLVQNITFKLTNNADSQATFGVSFDGELKDLLSLSDPTQQSITLQPYASGNVYVMLTFPNEIERAGKRTAVVAITEMAGAQGMGVSVLTGVAIPITIRVPYPGKYAELGVTVHDVEKSEKPFLTVTATNRGKEVIRKLVAYAEIYDGDLLMERIASDGVSLDPQKSETLTLTARRLFKPGQYTGVAYAQYDGKTSAKESIVLRVGQLFVNITGYTHEIEQDKVNRFTISVKNLWNEVIGNIAADVVLMSSDYVVRDVVKTSSINLSPWEESSLVTFVDTSNLSVGTSYVNITLLYQGITMRETFPVEIMPKAVQPKVEAPTSRVLQLRILLVAFILLIILNTIAIIFIKRKQHKDILEFKRKLDDEL